MSLLLIALAAAPMTNPEFLTEYAQTRRYVAGRPVSVRATPDQKKALFLRSEANDARQMLFELDLQTKKVELLLTPEDVLKGAQEQLTVAEKARLERMRVSAKGFTGYQLSDDGSKILVTLSGKLYVIDRESKKVTPLSTGAGAAIDAKFSQDASLVTFVRSNDVFAVDLKSNREQPLSFGGSDATPHGLAEFVAQEEMDRFSGYWLSEDAKSLVYQETSHTNVEQFSVADPQHPEALPERFYYPRPGKANAGVALFYKKVGEKKAREIVWDKAAFPYLATVKWKNGPLTLVVQNREQTREHVLAVDEKTLKTSPLCEEVDSAWIKIDQGFPHWVSGQGFLWLTERNGGSEVEWREPSGKLKKILVPVNAGYAGFVGFDEKTQTLFFRGGTNPTEASIFKVALGGAIEPVTGPGMLDAASLSGDGQLLALTRTSEKSMPITSIVKADGSVLADVPSVAKEPSLKLNIEFLQLETGVKSYAALVRPSDFVKGKKYPTILQVYGGPGHQEVLRSMKENLLLQWLANQQFIVVKIDGRGTPRRGREFERAIKNDFATITSADQLSALKALAEKYSEIDLKRVGAYGWSFGGYMAALLALKNSDVIKSAVAGAPVVDWRDYDTHYTERFLGLPERSPQSYEVSSLLTYVPQAQSPILLMHGTADDNVYFLHSLKLSDAMFKAGKAHSVLPLSNFTHMVPDPLVMQRQYERIAKWFQETL
jgi:dipeptidyl-peptidase 4